MTKMPLSLRLLSECLLGLALGALLVYILVVSAVPAEFVYRGF